MPRSRGACFQCLHFGGLGHRRMIVSEEMESAMNDEMSQVVSERLRFQGRFGAGRLERDDDVAESRGKSIRADSRENIGFGARER